MNTVIVSTTVDDVHASAVAVSLEKIGWRCHRWITSNLPSTQRSTIRIGDEVARVSIARNDLTDFSEFLTESDDYVFWNRRQSDHLFLDGHISKADAIIAEREALSFRDNLLSLVNRSRRRINDLHSARQAENKAFQLIEARLTGLSVPKTCISNSPSDIQEFIKFCGKKGCIAKPFRTGTWRSKDDLFVSYSSVVSESDLPSDAVLQLCPMIFQEFVDKLFDVRVTCFGSRLVALRIMSQGDPRSRIDWRTISPAYLRVERIELPEMVLISCQRLMSRLALSFGCIDFAVSKENVWYFLEVNQMGQFLFVEQIFPEFRMLDMFLQLLTREGDVQSSYYGLAFQDVAPDAYKLLEDEKKWCSPRRASGLVDEFNENGGEDGVVR